MAAESKAGPSFVVRVEVVNPADFLAGEPLQLAVEFPEGHDYLARQILRVAYMEWGDNEG